VTPLSQAFGERPVRAGASALGDQLAERGVRLALDRCRRDAYAQDSVALVHNRVAVRPWLEANDEIGVGHQLQYAGLKRPELV